MVGVQHRAARAVGVVVGALGQEARIQRRLASEVLLLGASPSEEASARVLGRREVEGRDRAALAGEAARRRAGGLVGHLERGPHGRGRRVAVLAQDRRELIRRVEAGPADRAVDGCAQRAARARRGVVAPGLDDGEGGPGDSCE